MAAPDDKTEKRLVGQMVGKGAAKLEFLYGSLSGMAFGLVSPIASQPFDTLKTKMQAEARYQSQGVITLAKNVMKADGPLGFYRGMLPILLSTGVQKTTLFAANAGARRACEQSQIPALVGCIPGSGGLKVSVIIGGVASGTARAVVETPFEFAKVRRQTGGSARATEGIFSMAQATQMYTGVFTTWYRGSVMLTSFFVLCDYTERAAPGLMAQPLLGGFLKGGICATLAWAAAWPLEVAKSNVQAANSQFKGESTLAILKHLVQADGFAGLYRGFIPGAMRSFVANGAGMAVYQFTQSLRKD